jgi:hypothetical protein
MHPIINSKSIKGLSQGFVTITIPVNANNKYINSLKCQEGSQDLDFHDPDVCLSAAIVTAIDYFENKLTGAPRDLLASRAPTLDYEALGSKGIVITVVTSKSQTVLRKVCTMFAQHFTPNKLYGMYQDMAKYRSTSTLGEKGKKGYSWASNQILAALKNVNIMITTNAKLDEKKIKDMVIAKVKAESLVGGVKPALENKAASTDTVVSSYENLATEITISSGPSVVIIRHFLWDAKIHSHYDGKTLYVYVAPTSWKTRSVALKKKKSVYLENKWKKMNANLGTAYLAMAVSSGICTSSELNSLKAGPSIADITTLLDKLF